MTLTADWFAYLSSARWFQSKGLGGTITALTPLPWLAQEEDCWVRSELATVSHAAGQDTYHLVVAYSPTAAAVTATPPDAVVTVTDLPGLGPAQVVDAPRSPAAMAVLLRGLATAPGVTWLAPPPDPALPTTVFTGEQSNTNVRIGDGVLLKILRKLTPGPSLDVEVLRALRGSGLAPELYGTWRDAARDVDLGVAMERVTDAADGWEWATQACRAGRDSAPEFRRLGQTLRRLHAALADAFPTAVATGADVVAQMTSRLDAAAADLPELAAYRDGLEAAFARLGTAELPVQRLHGDFHLGQVLLSPAGWTILDFEGEPLKTPAERRQPDSVWRDVAGLTRSIDYARSAHPDPASEAALTWAAQARAAFLAGYLGDSVTPPPALAAYEADKAIYELLYETRNRPTWTAIPRRALAALAHPT
ncbi:MAG: phosphotransferase [Propionibacteriaceae bacterium]|jgi:maltokinase|nr:phosphotransferase [Propionibacteriaceae bacterium]